MRRRTVRTASSSSSKTNVFSASWKQVGLGDDELLALQIAIMDDPTAAPVVVGTGGLRKLRFAPPGWRRGKSGAARVCYFYFQRWRVVLLMVAYAKGTRADLTPAQRKAFQSFARQAEAELAARPGGPTASRSETEEDTHGQ